MERISQLYLKYCGCCGKRLNMVPKRDVRRVSERDLLNINTVKPIIFILILMTYYNNDHGAVTQNITIYPDISSILLSMQ